MNQFQTGQVQGFGLGLLEAFSYSFLQMEPWLDASNPSDGTLAKCLNDIIFGF